MSTKPRPEPGVSYCAFPTGEFAEARSLEAAASLGRALGVDALEARAMLADGRAAAELRARARLTGPEALRQLERRFADPSMLGG